MKEALPEMLDDDYPPFLKTKASHPTEAVLGVDLDGNPVSFVLATGPHIIVAGTTGSGKSVYINSMLVSVMEHTTPKIIRMQWVDPKKVEATAYIGLPFCDNDPITDMADAYAYSLYLTWLMDERYEILAKYNVKKIDEYNELVVSGKIDDEIMPYFLFIVDEYADLMATSPDVEKNIARLAQKARACGIHCLIATQRPSIDVISGTLKSNIPTRIGLKTFDSNNSHIILDEGGCELLTGPGDSLLKDASGKVTRIQGPYISNEEIENIFAHLRAKYPPMEPIDYKTKLVDLGLVKWAMDYSDEVPVSERRVEAVRRRGSFF